MPDPKGNLVTPIGITAAGDLIALLIDDAGHLQVDIIAIPTGAVTVADGADVTQGALADAVVAAGAAGSISAKLRRLTTDLDALLTELQLKADFDETQPVSAATLPLPTDAATSANQALILGEVAEHYPVDRDPTDASLSYDASVGAHAETVRATYTVPGLRKAMIWAVAYWCRKAGTTGIAMACARFKGKRCSVLSFEFDTRLEYSGRSDPVQIIANTGDVIDITTYSSLDANASFGVFVHITEFT